MKVNQNTGSNRLKQDFLHPLVQLASKVNIKQSIFIIDDGVAEALRWNGAIDLLLHDFDVLNVYDWMTIKKLQSHQDIINLFNPFRLNSTQKFHIIVISSVFLHKILPSLQHLVQLGENKIQFTICSTLSEKAHQCQFDASSSAFSDIISELEQDIGDDWDDWNEEQPKSRIAIEHVPLHYSTILDDAPGGCSGCFVLSQPCSASVFPLMLSRLGHLKSKYESASEIVPEDIPPQIRTEFKLLAYTLGDIIMQFRLQVKENIYALGSTSLKVGHTLLQIINELQEELTTTEVGELQQASLILIDRTLDMASCTSHSSSLLDRIVSTLPQVSSSPSNNINGDDTCPRKHLHLTEVLPLGLQNSESVKGSAVLARVPWKGGIGLAQPTNFVGSFIFRSLCLRPPKLALRQVDKELREVISKLVSTKGIEKPKRSSNDRGRDVVLRWIQTIAETDRDTSYSIQSTLQLGLTMLEALDRIDSKCQHRDFMKELELKHVDYMQKRMTERILLNLAKALQSDVEKFTVYDILELGMHAFALAGSSGFDEVTTVKVFQDAFVDFMMRMKSEDVQSFATLSRTFREALSENTPVNCDRVGGGDDDWDWDDASPTDSQQNVNESKLRQVIELEAIRMVDCLQECGILRKELIGALSQYSIKNGELQPLLVQLCDNLTGSNYPNLGLHHIVDASEQLARVGIDFLKSGFSSVFGSSLSQPSASSTHFHPANAKQIIIFVIGGITFHEIQQIYEFMEDNDSVRILIGGTTIVNGEISTQQMYCNH